MKINLLLVILILCGCNSNNSTQKFYVKQNADVLPAAKKTVHLKNTSKDTALPYRIFIDSAQKVNTNSFYYRLLVKSQEQLKEVYRLKNEDHSIQISFKYMSHSDSSYYSCYEIADLPTGLTWNILFTNNGEVYKTQPYDYEALGDTLNRKSVNFNNKTATVVSDVKKTKYKIALSLIYRIK